MAETLGFIGLGIMGRPMAKNLMKAGYGLVVLDVNPAPVEELVGMGATAAKTPAEVASQVKKIITMLPDGPDVEKVVTGENGIIEAATSETILIDMSSISPTVTQKVVAALKEKGARALDAPVSGGEPGAIKGELAIMVGGPEDLFNEVKPIFEVLGKSAVLVGDTAAGQTTKLTNQILVGIHIQAMGEAFLLACKAGYDPIRVYEAIKGGLAGSNVLNAKIPLVTERNFKPGFKMRLHQKDLKNALEAASALGLKLPVTDMVKGFVDSLVSKGKGDDDHGGLIQELEALNNAEIRKLQ
ncbi:MAG: 2-hydroxy-3-oxopropionate reductase [Deltaproteobacteria bacterium]|nr:2-hydroxy-3-oxopropionate reductase [Deltaproteobacteria bacterium]MBW1960114.1 2-hydroxy-3-oxopropionate reductase [Deltaproteobacteria bacterium]MBW2153492.1 2-hydroxy-3-oxopropionate reductase [Deltaproteobacteria bacterium]